MVSKTKTDVIDYSTDDGWHGLYIDGRLVLEDHRISISDFVDFLHAAGLALDVNFRAYATSQKEERRITEEGFPDNVDDL